MQSLEISKIEAENATSYNGNGPTFSSQEIPNDSAQETIQAASSQL
jgi:hypothetical protein